MVTMVTTVTTLVTSVEICKVEICKVEICQAVGWINTVETCVITTVATRVATMVATSAAVRVADPTVIMVVAGDGVVHPGIAWAVHLGMEAGDGAITVVNGSLTDWVSLLPLLLVDLLLQPNQKDVHQQGCRNPTTQPPMVVGTRVKNGAIYGTYPANKKMVGTLYFSTPLYTSWHWEIKSLK